MAKRPEPQQRVMFYHDDYCIEHDGEQYIFRMRNHREPDDSRHAWQTKILHRSLDGIRNGIVHPSARIAHAQHVLAALDEAMSHAELLIPVPFNAKKEANAARAEKLRAARDKELAELDPPQA
jgi:hypothetical protein